MSVEIEVICKMSFAAHGFPSDPWWSDKTPKAVAERLTTKLNATAPDGFADFLRAEFRCHGDNAEVSIIAGRPADSRWAFLWLSDWALLHVCNPANGDYSVRLEFLCSY